MLITSTSKDLTMVGNLGKNCTLSVKNSTKVGTTLTIETTVLISPLSTPTDSMEVLKVLAKCLNLNYTVLKLSLAKNQLIAALLSSS